MGGAAFHPSLEDQDGGHTVHGLPALFDGEIGLAEEAVGLGGGQAFVPEVDWEFEVPAEIFGEGLDLFCLDALRTAHAQGEADYDLLDVVLPDQAVEVGEIILLVSAMQGFQTLRGDAKWIGDGNSDSPCPDIKTEYAVGQAGIGRHAGIIKRICRWVWAGVRGRGSGGCWAGWGRSPCNGSGWLRSFAPLDGRGGRPYTPLDGRGRPSLHSAGVGRPYTLLVGRPYVLLVVIPYCFP